MENTSEVLGAITELKKQKIAEEILKFNCTSINGLQATRDMLLEGSNSLSTYATEITTIFNDPEIESLFCAVKRVNILFKDILKIMEA